MSRMSYLSASLKPVLDDMDVPKMTSHEDSTEVDSTKVQNSSYTIHVKYVYIVYLVETICKILLVNDHFWLASLSRLT